MPERSRATRAAHGEQQRARRRKARAAANCTGSASYVFVSGKPYYAHPQYPVYDASVTNKIAVSRVGDRELAWFNSAKLACYAVDESRAPEEFARAWGKTEVAGLTPRWTLRHARRSSTGGREERRCRGHGHGSAGHRPARRQAALDTTAARAARPVGLGDWSATDDVLVTLENGAVVCFE